MIGAILRALHNYIIAIIQLLMSWGSPKSIAPSGLSPASIGFLGSVQDVIKTLDWKLALIKPSPKIRAIIPKMESQMDKKMEIQMETGAVEGFMGYAEKHLP